LGLSPALFTDWGAPFLSGFGRAAVFETGCRPFELAAGFLRIPSGENPLDNTGVHPERYPLLEGLANRLQKSVRDLMGSGVAIVKKDEQLKKEIGEFTFAGIRQAPAGDVKVEITFDVNVEGILTMTARDPDTGKDIRTTVRVTQT
jgi:transcriptional accessory protein Tex/SPT6